MEFEDKIPIGILYNEVSLDYQSKRPKLFNGVSIIDKVHDINKIDELLKTFC